MDRKGSEGAKEGRREGAKEGRGEEEKGGRKDSEGDKETRRQEGGFGHCNAPQPLPPNARVSTYFVHVRSQPFPQGLEISLKRMKNKLMMKN